MTNLGSRNYERNRIARGTRIFREGEQGGFAYLIERGSVEISSMKNGSKIVLDTLKDGEMFGEMALIDYRNRSATATALEDTDVIPFDRAQFEKIIESADPILNMLLRVVLKRFRWALQQVLEKERFMLTGEYNPGGQTQVFDAARNQAILQIKLDRDIRYALQNQEFLIYYQPILETHSHRIAGFEALIRWNHPVKGQIPPSDFVSAAEESDLIVPIGQWILEQACSDLRKLQDTDGDPSPGAPPLFMTVNVSPRQIAHLGNTEVLRKILHDAGIKPGHLKLEFTESMLIHSPELAARALADIQKLGVSLAIDDFGTGYSSLSYLHRFPLDVLKIDRSFINMMTKDNGSRQIVEAIMGLSKGLSLQTVAEGIESLESLAMLKALGCDYIQGYIASKPVPLSAALDLVRNRTDLLASHSPLREGLING